MAEMEWEIQVNMSHPETIVRIWTIVKCFQIQVTHSHYRHNSETTHCSNHLTNKLSNSTSSLFINHQSTNLNSSSSLIHNLSINNQVKLVKFNTFPRLQGQKIRPTTKESRAAKRIWSKLKKKLSVFILTRLSRTSEMYWARSSLLLPKDVQDCPQTATSQEAVSLTMT
jgi:hypothetical protein